MTELVLNISRAGFKSIRSSAVFARKTPASKTSAKLQEILLLGLILSVIQVLDGLMTGLGVAHFGTGIEANLFIRHLMEQLGFVNALLIVKSIGIAIVITLCYLALTVSWLTTALRGVIALYLLAAIIPWTAIYFLHLA